MKILKYCSFRQSYFHEKKEHKNFHYYLYKSDRYFMSPIHRLQDLGPSYFLKIHKAVILSDMTIGKFRHPSSSQIGK